MTAEKFIRETKGISDSDFMDSGVVNWVIELCEEYHKLASDGGLADVSDCVHPYEFVERDIITEITHCTKCNQDII